MTGTLFVVATPIGNLEDLTLRAKKVLEQVSLIACEDTRVTGKLLRRFQITTKMLSYHEHNELQRTPELVARLEEGSDIALVSDAGTPLVSDPGYRLVRAARERGISVRAVPGPSAPIAALSVSGLPTSPVTFIGFVPTKGAPRRRALEAAGKAPGTIVLFESAGRIARTLALLAEELGARPAVLLREMTKRYEEHREGTLVELAEAMEGERLRGELTLVIGPERPAPPVDIGNLGARFEALRREGLSAREASKRLAKELGLSARDVYNELHARKR